MSYTFLPYSIQKNIKREYQLRIIIVGLFFISLAIVIGVGSLFPAFIYSTFEEQLHLDQVATFKKSVDAIAIEANQKQLSSSGSLLGALDNYIEPSVFSNDIEKVVGVRGNVVINSISVEKTSKTQMMIAISGTAPTRSDLLSLKSRLSSLSSVSFVDLPISALAQDVKVDFTIQITEILP